MCQSVIIFCDPRLKRVGFQGLRKGLVIGREGLVAGFPHANDSSTGKGQRPSSKSASTPEYFTRPLWGRQRAKRVKVHSQLKLINTQNNQVCRQNKRSLCCVSNDMVCKPLKTPDVKEQACSEQVCALNKLGHVRLKIHRPPDEITQ